MMKMHVVVQQALLGLVREEQVELQGGPEVQHTIHHLPIIRNMNAPGWHDYVLANTVNLV